MISEITARGQLKSEGVPLKIQLSMSLNVFLSFKSVVTSKIKFGGGHIVLISRLNDGPLALSNMYKKRFTS